MSEPPSSAQEGPQARPGDLARAARAGTPGALERWFGAEHAHVWKLAYGLLADRAEADDLAQDAMLHLHDHLHDWDPERPWNTWRNTVVANLCRDRLRRRSTRARIEEDAAEERSEARVRAPHENAHGSEVRAALAAALGTLSPREREVFVLRDLEGEPTADVSRALGITEGSVRSLLTLARRRLRGVLAARVPGLVPDGGCA